MLTKSLSYLFTTADFLLVYLLTRPTVNKENSYMVASSRCNFFFIDQMFSSTQSNCETVEANCNFRVFKCLL